MTTEVVTGVAVAVVVVGVVDVAGVIGRIRIVAMVVAGVETERNQITVHRGGVLGMVTVEEEDGEAFLELKFRIHQVRKLFPVAG